MLKCLPKYRGDQCARVWVTLPISKFTEPHIDAVLTLLAKSGGVTASSGFSGKWGGGLDDPTVMLAFGYLTGTMRFEELRRSIAQVLLLDAREAEALIVRDEVRVWRQVLDLDAGKKVVERSSLLTTPLHWHGNIKMQVLGPTQPPLSVVRHFAEEAQDTAANFGMNTWLGEDGAQFDRALAVAISMCGPGNNDPDEETCLLARLEFVRAAWDIAMERMLVGSVRAVEDLWFSVPQLERDSFKRCATSHWRRSVDPLLWDDWGGLIRGPEHSIYAMSCFLRMASGVPVP